MDYGYWPHQDSSSLMVPWLNSGEDRAAATTAASRSHSEAEKRRRDRINSQLSTLRKLIPKSEKMDKAALLGQVVHHVREQSKKAKEATSKVSTVPAEADEVIIDDHRNVDDQENIYMKASLSCEDRPELFSELNSALKGLEIAIVDAQIFTLGGRTRINFVLRANGGDHKGSPLLVRQSVKVALSRVVISAGAACYSARSKRQRFFYPNNSN
ncbi:transcription factor bHLH51 [Andrographis paniculata]|uniref:transcription factor bHLH51 n=1 Tax=Andrographis paniculata TaxID=175694 RepID=UPI0021E98D60|nr:transcription factor bHLH51 [Andrographis paniculata]